MKINVEPVATWSDKVLDEAQRAIVGKRQNLRIILAAILAEGHVLIEDYPGLAKTLMARSLASALGLDFKRVQFTPDLLPGDITGSYVYNRKNEKFQLREGPIFANIILADEINRASPKTQAALLEAMQEYQVTLEGETRSLPRPFFVLATQNPIEYEGTFPLPEAQLDRFLVRIDVGYPTEEEEKNILRQRRERMSEEFSLSVVSGAEELLEMRSLVEQIHIDDDLETYIVSLVRETRRSRKVAVGASPRGSLALMKLSRSLAAMDGRSYVLPDDIKTLAEPTLAHRLILIPDLWMKKDAASDVIQGILNTVKVPVIEEKEA